MKNDPPEVQVPDGYVHRGQLIARGWTAELLAPLAEHAIRLDDVPPGASNRAYPAGVVAAYEAGDPQVRRALDNAASVVPHGEVTHDQAGTLSRADILARGWTTAHIDRLLGASDYKHPGRWFNIGASGAPRLSTDYGEYRYVKLANVPPRWTLARVEAAERTDARLRETIAARAKTREDAIAARINSGERIFRRRGRLWVVAGFDLTPDEVVIVTRADGTTQRVEIDRILERDVEGRAVATFREYIAPRPPCPEPPPRPPVPSEALGTYRTDHAPVLDEPVRTQAGDYVVPLAANRLTLGDGTHGYEVTHRPATPTETADLATGTGGFPQAVVEAESAIVEVFRRRGHQPDKTTPLGQVLADTRGITGGGRAYVVDDDGTTLWLIEPQLSHGTGLTGARFTALERHAVPTLLPQLQDLDTTMKASTR